MDNLLNLKLRAFSHELKHDREYKIGLGQDLFRKIALAISAGCSWGCIGVLAGALGALISKEIEAARPITACASCSSS